MNRAAWFRCIPIALVAVVLISGRSETRQGNARPELAKLIDALDTKDDAAFVQARSNLVRAVTKKDLPALIKAATNKGPRVRVAVLHCLSHFLHHHPTEPPDVTRFLLLCLRDKDAGVRFEAAAAAPRWAGEEPDLITAIFKALDDDAEYQFPEDKRQKWLVASAPLFNLRFLGKAARPIYLKLIRMAEQHPNKQTRERAVVALGDFSRLDQSHRPLFYTTLLKLVESDKDEKMRMLALACMAPIPNEQEWVLAPAIRKLWKAELEKGTEASPQMQETILDIFRRIGPDAKEVLPDLLPVLADTQSNRRVRHEIMSLANHLGKDGKAAVPLLQKIANDERENARTREIARIYAQQITAKQ